MTSENYQDIDGNPIALDKLVRDEPEWACNLIREFRKRVTALESLLHEATPNETPCIHYGHNAEDCTRTTLPRAEWCWPCRVSATLAGVA